MNYIVKSGDSVSKIARDVLGDITLWPEIVRLNSLADANRIFPGQVLTLPVGNKATTATQTAPDGGAQATGRGKVWKWVGIAAILTAAGVAYSRYQKKKKATK